MRPLIIPDKVVISEVHLYVPNSCLLTFPKSGNFKASEGNSLLWKKKKKNKIKSRHSDSKFKSPSYIFITEMHVVYLNLFLMAPQILEKQHLENHMFLQCVCLWLTYTHYRWIFKRLSYFSIIIRNLHLL